MYWCLHCPDVVHSLLLSGICMIGCTFLIPLQYYDVVILYQSVYSLTEFWHQESLGIFEAARMCEENFCHIWTRFICAFSISLSYATSIIYWLLTYSFWNHFTNNSTFFDKVKEKCNFCSYLFCGTVKCYIKW